jgi:hypothetical protein
MTAALLERRPTPPPADGVAGLRLIVLSRIACEEGATRPELARELASVVAGMQGRLAIDTEVAELVRAGLAVELRSRFTASAAGVAQLLCALGIKSLPRSWSELRDIRLVAKALGIEGLSASRLKSLVGPDGLRVEILSERYGLVLRGRATASKVRAALALVALGRAFGNEIQGDLATGSDFNAKTARVLAGQLLRKPRDTGTDKRLVTLLAAEAVGSAGVDADSLRHALLRRLAGVQQQGSAGVQPGAGGGKRTEPAKVPARVPARASASTVTPPGSRPAAAARPDIAGFVKNVQQAARRHAEGWPGNRKALVSRVFGAIAEEYPGWGLTVVEFKAMLAECHRLGHLALVTADLKDKSQLEALRASAIAYKNTVWHLVRVED